MGLFPGWIRKSRGLILTNHIIIADSGYWLALLDHRDQFHSDASIHSIFLDSYQILFPWPCLYETICTRLVRQRDRVLRLQELLTKPNIVRFDDAKYRDCALDAVFNLERSVGFTYSLTDSIIREMIRDRNLRIKYLITFNDRDFKDLENEWFKIV